MATKKKAKSPKAKIPASLESGCLRYRTPGKGLRCRNWSHCFECWFDSGHKMADHVLDPHEGHGRAPCVPHVESGIHLLADLIARQRSAQKGYEVSPLTGSTSYGQQMFKSNVFDMTPTHTPDGTTTSDIPNFEYFGPGPYPPLQVWWHKHAGNGCWMSREVKGREWSRIMMNCLEDIS